MKKFFTNMLLCSLLVLSLGSTSFSAPKKKRAKQRVVKLEQQEIINQELEQPNNNQEIAEQPVIIEQPVVEQQVEIINPEQKEVKFLSKLSNLLKDASKKTKGVAVESLTFSKNHKKEIALGSLLVGMTALSIYKRKSIIKFMKNNPKISISLIGTALAGLTTGFFIYKDKEAVCSLVKRSFDGSKQFISEHKISLILSSVVLFVTGFVAYDIIENGSEFTEKLTPELLYSKIVSKAK